MRASRADRAAAATAALLLLLLTRPAAAEIGPPVPLAPPAPRATPATPPVAPSTQPPPGAPSSDEDIHAMPLAPMDPSWIGTLGPSDGALSRDMWSGTPRALVSAALPLLRPTTSPTLQDLSRRLLLSDAVAPAGQDVAPQPNLAVLRLNRLLALGRVDGTALIDALPQNVANETFDRDSVELRLAANDLSGACRSVQERVARYRNAWWDRATIACQALNGAHEQAGLGLSVLREQKGASDPVFEGLIDTIDGHRQKLDKLPDPTPMRMALWAAAKLPLPADVLTTAGPAALLIWATSDKVPAVQRLPAAERAEALGALPPDGLGLLYGNIDAKPDEQAAVLASGKLPVDARSRAILYGVARANGSPAARIAALTPLLADAKRRGVFSPVARLVAPLVAELQPGPDTQSFAGDAARVLLAAGNPDQAGPWVDLANLPELQIVAGLAQPHRDVAALSLANIIAALTKRDPAAAPRQIDLLIALLNALGEKIVAVDAAPLVQPPHQGLLPGATLWLDQQQAAASGRVGETILTSLLIATAGEQLSPEPVLLANVVSGLKAVGLETEARAIAVEAALAAGI
jgi:hypothetical protein